MRSRLSGRWLGLGPPVRAGMGDVSAAAIAVEGWQKWGMPKAVEVQDCVRSRLSGRWLELGPPVRAGMGDVSAVRRLSGRWLGLGPPVRAGMGDVSAAAVAVERWQKWDMPKAVEVQDCVRSRLSGR